MLEIIALGSLLMVVTTGIHAGAMLLLVQALRATRAERWARSSHWTRMTVVWLGVLVLVGASMLEACVWAVAYFAVGALSDYETALYFSAVTFTTLGYGDVVLPTGWRLLAALQAANGVVVFGWTTALIFYLVQRLYLPKRS